AGDSFVGATLNKLDEIGKKVDELTEDEIKNILNFANKVGSITATKKGAMDSLPSKDDIA
ncbi:MAG: carbohydrate kinase, partial [Peptostreptococcaceae bacterium]|nr:carbohydrate kinase [Peptostreptococcaceae bacterium]